MVELLDAWVMQTVASFLDIKYQDYQVQTALKGYDSHFCDFFKHNFFFFQKMVMMHDIQWAESTNLQKAVVIRTCRAPGMLFPKLLFATCEHIAQQGLCLKELP